MNPKPKLAKWIGRRIVSQYGLLCVVTDVTDTDVICHSEMPKRQWEFPSDKISLIMKNDEILDPNKGEVWGKLTHDDRDFIIYPDEECRIISKEEIDKEFT